MRTLLRVACASATLMCVACAPEQTADAAGVAVQADRLTCSLAEYTASPGLAAAVADNTLTLTWDGDPSQEVRLRLTINAGTPTIRDLAVRSNRGQWSTVASNVTPEFRVVSGVRRVQLGQLSALRELGIEITPEIIEREKWNAFWDAPLLIPGTQDGREPGNPDLPRKPEEINRATATYQARSCAVKTNGARLEIAFPGVELGVFSGRLQYTVYKGTNLIRQEVIAKTEDPSVAYKYDAGLKGLAIQPTSRVAWRDLAKNWQDYRFGGANNEAPAVLKTSNRLVVAEGPGGSIAAFPPPHTFHWARETEQTLPYSWYRKDSDASFAFGMRQAESEEDPQWIPNFALYNARPGTWQRMPVFLYVSAERAEAAIEPALAFTRGDRFKSLPGYQVMGSHYHVGLVQRLLDSGNLDAGLPDFEAAKAAGINIFGVIDGARHAGRPSSRDVRLKGMAEYYEAARRHSDKDFLIMPNEEFSSHLGGHSDILLSKPIFWGQARAKGQPFVEEHPTYGKVYNVGDAADLMEMAKRENALIFMPHPRTKSSTGYPDGIKQTDHFLHEHYRGVGFRWGMGIDGSETRLCELRCLALFDDMNNWVADLPTPPKYIQAIAETRSDKHARAETRAGYIQAIKGARGKLPGDDTYGMSPINYLKVDRLPMVDDMRSIIDAMKRGEYFVTSGEVLIPSYAVQGTGAQRTITAEVEWTFPLDFVEVVWGDGQKTDRQIISATDLPPFGRHRFQIPFNAVGKKWVRFAAWDSAGNGALVQPIKLERAPSTTSR